MGRVKNNLPGKKPLIGLAETLTLLVKLLVVVLLLHGIYS